MKQADRLNHCKAFPRSDSEIFPTAIHLSEKNQYLPDSEEEEQSQEFAEMKQADSLTLDKAVTRADL